MQNGVLSHRLQDWGSTTHLNWVLLSGNRRLTSTSTPDWLASAAQKLPVFLVASGSLLAWAQWGLCPYSLSEGRFSDAGPRVHPLPGLGGTGPEAARGERREGAAPGPPCHCLWGRSEQLRSAPWPGGCLKQQLPLWAPVSRWIRPASLLKLASEDQLHPVVVSSD